MSKAQDITGMKFHSLTAIEFVRYDRGKGAVWKCLCDCGKETFVHREKLRKGDRRSCGCNKNNVKDLTGHRFGSLIAIEPTEKRVSGSVVWRCTCDCGKEKFAPASELNVGNVKSCGCLYGRSKRKYLDEYERIFSCRVPDNHSIILLDGNPNNLSMENMVLVKDSIAKTLKKRNLLSIDPELTSAAIRLTELRAKVFEIEKDKRRIS